MGVSGAIDSGVAAGGLAYFHPTAALGLAVGALVAIPIGPAAHRRLSSQALGWLFAGVFFALGLRLIVGNLFTLSGR